MGTDQPPRSSSTPNTMHRGQHGGSTPINNMEVALRPSTAKKSLNCETIFYFISTCLVKVKHISIIHYCSTVNHHQQIPGHTHGQSSIPLGNDLILNTLNFNKSLCHYCSTVNRHQQIPGNLQGQSSIPLGNDLILNTSY